MNHTTHHLAGSDGRFRRRRPGHPLGVLDLLSERETAAAMDDAAKAEQLMDDLVALIDTGLIEPVQADGQTRYAPARPDAEEPRR
jgi:hypothetical protein